MAIVGQTRGTYNYNTLVRTNDGTAFEFNTNATVLFVDELPSGVTLNASFDSPSNPQILLREKVQLRFIPNEFKILRITAVHNQCNNRRNNYGAVEN